MSVIWKFNLRGDDEEVVPMPDGSEILSVGVQMGVACLWALVHDVGAPLEDRKIQTWMTGQEGGAAGAYIGTYQIISSMSGGPGRLVCHVFEADRVSGT